MQKLSEAMKSIGVIPPEVWVWLIVLAAFALSAFAIHAVVTIAKGRK